MLDRSWQRCKGITCMPGLNCSASDLLQTEMRSIVGGAMVCLRLISAGR